MAIVTFTGLPANNFAPYYGSAILESKMAQFAAGSYSLEYDSTHIWVRIDTFPVIQMEGSFNVTSEQAVLSSFLTSVRVEFGFNIEFIVRQTVASFLNTGLTQGAFGGNDTITGSTYNDLLRGMAGNDTINGGAGADYITGDAGNDILIGGAEVGDQLLGGIGDDVYRITRLDDVIQELAGQGTDRVESAGSYTLGENLENLTLTGTDNVEGTGNALANIITGNEGNNVLSGLGGNDSLKGAGGNDELHGGEGSDSLDGGAGTDILDGGAGADTLTGGAGDDTYVVDNTLDKVVEAPNGGTDTVESSITHTLAASVENLTLTGTDDINGTGNGLANIITGNSGNNILNGGLGADTLIGGLGDDTYVIDVADTVSETGGGNDTVQLAYNVSATVPVEVSLGLFAGIENLTATGTGRFDLTGDGGDNVLTGNASVNTLTGGLGNDTYVINSLTDVVVELPGGGDEDTVRTTVSLSALAPLAANVENLVLLGAALNGFGNGLDNTLTGNAAANVLNGGEGEDEMIGLGGNDTYIVDDEDDAVTEAAAGGTDTVQASVTYTLSDNVENLTLTGTAADGTGNLLANIITGNASANVLNGGANADTMTGGAGDDTYVVDNAGDKATEAIAGVPGGIDTVEASVSFILGLNVENLTLTGIADINGTGNGLANIITGNSGNNILNGGLGADTLIGGLGDDTYVIDVADTVSETGGGNDTVQLAYNVSATVPVTITLGVGMFAGIENLTATGTGRFNLTGDGGDNVLTGNASVNTLTGGLGNDTYVISSLADVVVELPGGGDEDTVRTTVSLSALAPLAANVENLVLLGAALNGFGNGLDNTLTGNAAANTLNGLGGVDEMIGLGGNDTYIVDDEDDVVTEAAAGGTDTVQASVTYTLSDNVENLTLTGTAADGTGNLLANIIIGNGENNRLDGGANADTMTGGAGDDTYVVDNAGDKATEAIAGVPGGIDTVEASVSFILGLNVENLTLTGIADINGTGNGLANIITGNSGNNILNGGLGADTLIGGLGDDTYVIDVADTVSETGGGNDTVQLAYNVSATVPVEVSLGLFAGIENLTATGTGRFDLTGDGGDNVLTGNASVNTLTGGLGNDTLDGGLGNDILDGGDGDDTYVVSAATDTIIDASGDDTVRAGFTFSIAGLGAIENLTLTGALAINATGNDRDNTLTGNAAANVLNGGEGEDEMIGLGGNDTYIVDDDDDVVIEAAAGGTDTVQASVITYTLSDNVENLTLTGSAADGTGNLLANILTGNAANNRLDGGANADTMTGGAGDDTYVVDNALDKVVEAPNGGTDTVESSVTHTLAASVENLILTGTDDINGTGNGLANIITGNSGNNILNGGAGIDDLIGGDGDDTYVLDNVDDSFTEATGEGTDTIQLAYNVSGSVATEFLLGAGIYTDIENLTATGTGLFRLVGDDGDNVLIGNASANTLIGDDGNDTLDGGLGSDSLTGGDGDDIYLINVLTDAVIEGSGLLSGEDTVKSTVSLTALNALAQNVENLILLGTAANGFGNALDNTITGNAAANLLNGGEGVDEMIGGAGNDTYVVDEEGDQAIETLSGAAGGTDLVLSEKNFTLGDYVENLTLIGLGNVNATGNTLNNVLIGNSGDNRLDGGEGADAMTGGAGNDTYVVDNPLDKVTETLAGIAGGPSDKVESSITYTLGANVENLQLTGSANINGTGNSLVNTLTGNSGNNILNGGAGADFLIGGDGDDTYVYDGIDSITEEADKGSDTVQLAANISTAVLTSVTISVDMFLSIENLTAVGTGRYNLTGNSADNKLVGNASNNTLIGGDGNDILLGGGGLDMLNGGAGNDTLDAGGGGTATNPEVLTGGLGDDTYYVGNLSTVRIAETNGQGTDTVVIGFTAGLGDFSTVSVIRGFGPLELENLTLTGTANIDAFGNDGANRLLGNAGRNTLVGDEGNDYLDGGAGADTLLGGTGDDRYVVDNPGDVIIELAGEGTDTVVVTGNTDLRTLSAYVENVELAGAAAASITGNDRDNTITGNAAGNTLDGGAGNDYLDGGAGADHLVGGAGNDTFVFDDAGDTLQELADGGVDTLVINRDVELTFDFSNIENATLTGIADLSAIGNDQDNHLVGNDGDNVLSGGDGNDILDGGAGADDMTGGLGNDTYILDNAGDAFHENGGEGSDTVRIGGRHIDLGTSEFDNIENATLLGSGAFNLTGTGEDNTLIGNSGVNALVGGNGSDTLDGGAGADTMTGGDGNDTYYIDNAGDVIVETPTGGTDTVYTYLGNYTLESNIENAVLAASATGLGLTGNGLNNILTGNSAGNLLDGGLGEDHMFGGEGNDIYTVDNLLDTVVELTGQGTDSVISSVTFVLGNNVENLTLTAAGTGTGNGLNNNLTGSNGVDILDGLGGNDLIDGGANADTLSGGDGDDRFVFDVTDASVQGGTGFDRIVMTGSGTLDLTLVSDNVYTGIESLYTQNGTFNQIKLSNADILALAHDGSSDGIYVTGDFILGNSDAIQFTSGGWNQVLGDSRILDNWGYNVWHSDAVGVDVFVYGGMIVN